MIHFSDSPNPTDPTITVFECSNVRQDTGLLLFLKQNNDKDKFNFLIKQKNNC